MPTPDFAGQERRRAASISVLMASYSAVFGFVGQFLLAAMGISPCPSKPGACFLFAVSMVLGNASHVIDAPAKRGNAAARRAAVMQIAVYPREIIAGPGGMPRSCF